MTIQRVNYNSLPNPVGPYVHACKSQGLLFTSGLTAASSAAEFEPLDKQLLTILDQLNSLLNEEGLSQDSLIKVTFYVCDIQQIGLIRPILQDYYQGSMPASSLVQVQQLFAKHILLEMEAIAAY